MLLLAILSITLFSCKKQVDDTISGANQYFPLEIGRYVIYDVDSTIWTTFDCTNNRRDTSLQMMYTVADTFRDDQDRLSHRIEVRARKADTAQWQVHSVYYATLTPASIEMVQSNYRFIKMVFPIEDGITWKGNTYIPSADADNMNYSDWTYIYSGKEQPYFNGKATFEKTVTVDQADFGVNYESVDATDSTYADRTYGQEVYGYNVGMVYKEITHWERQPDNCREGYTVIMRAIDHN